MAAAAMSAVLDAPRQGGISKLAAALFCRGEAPMLE